MQASKHILPLDGVRGLAALLVTLNHCLSLPEASLPTRFIGQVSETGWIGVDLFFVLSGFLITGILLDTRHHSTYFKNFYVRRSLRIFPLYYATLLLFLVVAPLALSIIAPGSRAAERVAELRADQWWYWTYMENWLFVKLDGWPSAGHFTHFWSLAIEEQFYLAWPLVVWLCGKRGLLAVCVAGCIAGPVSRWMFIASGTSWVPPYVATNARIDLLCVGAAIAIGWRSRWRPTLQKSTTWAALSIAGLMMLAVLHAKFDMLKTSETSLIAIRHTLLGGVFGATLISAASAAPGTLLYRMWTNRPLVWCGVYSYGLYVYHWPICQALRKVSFEWCPADARPWVFLLACLAPTCVVAALSMRFLERPFLRLKRLWDYDERRIPVETGRVASTQVVS